MVGSEAVPEGQEGEELHIALDQQFEDDPPEAVGPQQTANLEVEQAVEKPVEEEDQQQHYGHMESKEVHGAGQEQVVLPFLLHVLLVGLWVVEVHLLDGCLHRLLRFLQPGDFPLFLLHKPDGLKDRQYSAIVGLVVVVVQPEAIQAQEQ